LGIVYPRNIIAKLLKKKTDLWPLKYEDASVCIGKIDDYCYRFIFMRNCFHEMLFQFCFKQLKEFVDHRIEKVGSIFEMK
jgi:hypothetical protein